MVGIKNLYFQLGFRAFFPIFYFIIAAFSLFISFLFYDVGDTVPIFITVFFYLNYIPVALTYSLGLIGSTIFGAIIFSALFYFVCGFILDMLIEGILKILSLKNKTQ